MLTQEVTSSKSVVEPSEPTALNTGRYAERLWGYNGEVGSYSEMGRRYERDRAEFWKQRYQELRVVRSPINNMKRAYVSWHIRRYGHEPQWGNGETIEQYRGWRAAWRVKSIEHKTRERYHRNIKDRARNTARIS